MKLAWKAAAFLAVCLVAAPPAGRAVAAEQPWTVLSPWTLNRSGHFVQGAFSLGSSDQYYDAAGVKLTNPAGKLRDFTAGAHVEYGLRDYLGLYFALPVRALKQDGVAGDDITRTGIGDLLGGLRLRLLQGPLTVSAQGDVLLPTGYRREVAAPPYDTAKRPPALGPGAKEFTGRLLGGYSFTGLPGFVQAAAGYRVRKGSHETLANQFVLNADGGVWPSERFFVAAHWEWAKHSGSTKLPVDLNRAGAELRYRLKGALDLMGGAFRTFGGINAPAGMQVFVGLSTKGNVLARNQGLLAAGMARSAAAPPPAEAPQPVPATPSVPDSVRAPAPAPSAPDTSSTPTPPDTSSTPPPPTPPGF